jgi:hypothetical protein
MTFIALQYFSIYSHFFSQKKSPVSGPLDGICTWNSSSVNFWTACKTSEDRLSKFHEYKIIYTINKEVVE